MLLGHLFAFLIDLQQVLELLILLELSLDIASFSMVKTLEPLNERSIKEEIKRKIPDLVPRSAENPDLARALLLLLAVRNKLVLLLPSLSWFALLSDLFISCKSFWVVEKSE